MGPVERQLERLDSETAELTAKADAAWDAFFKATDVRQKVVLEKRYEHLEVLKKDCLSQRHELQLKLFSSGEHMDDLPLSFCHLGSLRAIGVAIYAVQGNYVIEERGHTALARRSP